MNARRRLHDKWQNGDYDQNGAKNEFSENNNLENNGMHSISAGASAGIMIVDGFSGSGNGNTGGANGGQNMNQQPHDLSFALEAIESIEQPPPPVCSDNHSDHHTNHTNSNCVYSLTSLWFDEFFPLHTKKGNKILLDTSTYYICYKTQPPTNKSLDLIWSTLKVWCVMILCEL